MIQGGGYRFDDGGECRFFLDSDIVDQLAESLSSGGVLTNDAAKVLTDDEVTTEVRDKTILNGSLDLEKTGLTKDALRDLVLASYITQATTDTVVGIEIPEEELDPILKGLLDSYVSGGNIPVLSQLQGITNFTSKLVSDWGLSDFSQNSGGNEADGNRWGYFRFGKFYYYRIQTTDDNGDTVYKYYLAEKGIIQILNENGNPIKCYDNKTFEGYLNWFNGNGNIVDQSKVGPSYAADVFYTVPEIGKIKIVTVANNNGSYSFDEQEINYASTTEISNCTVPIELLVDFLSVSASSDFMSAFEELIKEQEIIMRLYPLTTTETVETHTEQTANPSAVLDIYAHYDNVLNMHLADEECVDGDTDRTTEPLNLDPITVTSDTTSYKSNTTYELVLEKANTWYFTAERTVGKNNTVNGPNSEDFDIPGYTISGSGNAAFNDSRLGTANIASLNAQIAASDLKTRLTNILGDKFGYVINIDVSTINVASTKVEVQDGTKTVTTTTTTEALNKGAMQYNDNTDAFLGLWKNSSGQYEKGALFDSDGKKVGYHDLYGDDDAYVADLFENADLELFELLDISEHTQSYTPVMKYILYRYNGTDYGITTFEQLLELLGFNIKKVGGDYNVNTASAEGQKIAPTKDQLKAAFASTPYANVLSGDVDAIYSAQERYNVNGIFTAAVAIVESSAGTDRSGAYGSGTCSMFSLLTGSSFRGYDQAGRNAEIGDFAKLISGSLYFGDGRYTVSGIGERYCVPPDDWINDVRAQMTEMFKAAGIDVSSVMGGEILQVCQEVTNHYLGMNAQYSLSNLIWGNIEGCWNHRYICCATYVSMVLYQSGALTADQINAYNYHWTGSGGVPDMLAAAGWYKVPQSEMQPGDVLNRTGYHVMIYAGDGKVWDQNTCTGACYPGPFSQSMSGYDVWRAP